MSDTMLHPTEKKPLPMCLLARWPSRQV